MRRRPSGAGCASSSEMRLPEEFVAVDDRDGAGLEQLREEPALGLEVRLEVAVEIQVIARQVREARRGEGQTGHAFLG